jgi:hypothetical protein
MPQTMNPDLKKGVEDMKQHHVASISALHESGKTLHKGLTDISQFYNEHVADSFNSAMETMKSMCSAKTPQEALNIHKEWLQGSLKNHMDKTTQMSQKTAALMKEVTHPIQELSKKTSESFKAK